MLGDPPDAIRLLGEMREGDPAAADRLFPLVYSELRRLAAHYMRGERLDHTLQPTALVNEAYLRMKGDHGGGWQSRAHFVAVAARTMRHLLVDYARSHVADKRGGPSDTITIREGLNGRRTTARTVFMVAQRVSTSAFGRLASPSPLRA